MVNPLGAIVAGAGGGLAAGAGSSLVNLALVSYTSANTFINSYYFGYGMILGERDMYQNDWPKIQDRLEKGETFINILEEKMREKTSAIMAMAQNIQLTVEAEYSTPMLQRLLAKPEEAFQELLKWLGIGGDTGALTEEEFIEHLKVDTSHSDVGKRPHTHGTGAGIPDIIGGDPTTPVPGPETGGRQPGGRTPQVQKPAAPTHVKTLYIKTWKQIYQVDDAIDLLYKQYVACRATKTPDAVCRNKPSFKLMVKISAENSQRRIALQTMEQQYRDLHLSKPNK